MNVGPTAIATACAPLLRTSSNPAVPGISRCRGGAPVWMSVARERTRNRAGATSAADDKDSAFDVVAAAVGCVPHTVLAGEEKR